MILAEISRVIFDSSQRDPMNNNGFMIIEYVCLSKPEDLPMSVNEKGESLHGKTFIAKGNHLATSQALTYHLYGTWETDRNGRFFKADYSEIIVESNKQSIINYFTSGLFPGIGIKLANAIYKQFGDEAINVLENDPDSYLEVPGIKESRLATMKSAYEAHNGSKEAVLFFSKMNIPTDLSLRAYTYFKEKELNVIDVFKENPYELLRIRKFDFGTVDGLALSNGFTHKSSQRIQAAVLEVLKQVEGFGGFGGIANPGSTCTYIRPLITETVRFLKFTISEEDVKRELSVMRKNKRIACIAVNVKDGKDILVYRQETHIRENFIANKIVEMKEPIELSYDIDDEINRIQVNTMIKLDPKQAEAVRNGLENKMSVITGGPGTGKTTIIKFIYEIFKDNNPGADVMMCAPTAKASRKMSESTGSYAGTIHKMFGIMPLEEDGELEEEVKDASLTIEADLIIIDEASMIDIYVMTEIMNKIGENSQVILIGDVDQLPSVSAGAVLRDLIESNVIPVARLSAIHRQAEQSYIVRNAELINKGNTNLGFNKDFVFIEANSLAESEEIIKKEFQKYSRYLSIEEIIVLSPFRKKGVNLLNPALQEVYNPLKEGEMEITSKKFRVGDMVMQTRNSYNSGVANGDVGIITWINPDQKGEVRLSVDFGSGEEIDYRSDDLLDLELAYARTIHSSQGSEYELVIVNLLDAHSIMLQRNLVYTAITRSKKRVVVVGQKSALDRSIVTKGGQRLTTLNQKLQFFNAKKEREA